MSLALLFHYLMLNMFWMLVHPSSGACDLFVELFHGLYCSGSMCVGVTLWFGWGGVVSLCRQHGYHANPTTPKHQHTSNQKHTTNLVIQQNSHKLLMMDILMSETCWAHKNWNKNSKWRQVGLLFSMYFYIHLSVIVIICVFLYMKDQH